MSSRRQAWASLRRSACVGRPRHTLSLQVGRGRA